MPCFYAVKKNVNWTTGDHSHFVQILSHCAVHLKLICANYTSVKNYKTTCFLNRIKIGEALEKQNLVYDTTFVGIVLGFF